MGVLWADGFEQDDQEARGQVNTPANVEPHTDYGRNSRKGVRLGDSSNTFYQSPILTASDAGDNSLWWHFRMKIVSAASNAVRFNVDAAGAQMTLSINGTTSGTFDLVNWDGTIDTPAFGSWVLNGWNDFFIEKTYSATTGSLKVWINGNLEYSATGQDTGTHPGETDIKLASNGSSDINYGYFMDCVIGDGSGSPGSAFPLSLEPHTLLPDGNGNASDMLGSDGNSTDNYLLVDEAPADTADYVGSATEGDQDTYTMDNLASTTETIHAVIAEVYGAKSDSGDKFMRPVIRTSSTDYVGTSLGLGETHAMQHDVWDDNPNTTNPWTGSEVNSIEVGQEVRDS